MKIKKGEKLIIKHSRKGKFNAIACEDFDTKTAEFYPVIVEADYVEGMVNTWVNGEKIPCKAKFVSSIELTK